MTAYSRLLAIIAISFFTFGLAAPHAMAAEKPQLLGSFGAWKAYKYLDDGKPVCFMSATPQKAEGKYTRRGEIYAMIAHRPKENSRDVFSYITGYTYKKNGDITVTIGKDKFALYGEGESAWTPNDKEDSRLSIAIQKGSSMVVHGVSSRGTKTKDTYSLKGSGDAYAAISRACGL